MATACCEGQKDKRVKKKKLGKLLGKKDPLRAIKHKNALAASGSGNLDATDCMKMREHTKTVLYS